MYHSLIFIDDSGKRIHTWDNWRLIPSSRPVIVQPTPTLKYVDIPGRSGQLDISDYLTGKIIYSDRKGSLEFIAVNIVGNVVNYGPKRNFKKKVDFQKDVAKSYYSSWANRRTEIAKFLDGRKMKIFLEDDPNYYYYGRVTFKDWKSDANFSKVTIEYQVGPYRYLTDGKEAGL